MQLKTPERTHDFFFCRGDRRRGSRELRGHLTPGENWPSLSTQGQGEIVEANIDDVEVIASCIFSQWKK